MPIGTDRDGRAAGGNPFPASAGLTGTYPVLGAGYLLAGRAAAEIKRRLQEFGLPGELIRRVVVVAYEAEMNICLHAISGEVLMTVEGDRVVVVAWDRGPGIADVGRALTPGFSTASPKARQHGVSILTSRETAFTVAGRLYEMGVR